MSPLTVLAVFAVIFPRSYPTRPWSPRSCSVPGCGPRSSGAASPPRSRPTTRSPTVPKCRKGTLAVRERVSASRPDPPIRQRRGEPGEISTWTLRDRASPALQPSIAVADRPTSRLLHQGGSSLFEREDDPARAIGHARWPLIRADVVFLTTGGRYRLEPVTPPCKAALRMRNAETQKRRKPTSASRQVKGLQ